MQRLGAATFGSGCYSISPVVRALVPDVVVSACCLVFLCSHPATGYDSLRTRLNSDLLVEEVVLVLLEDGTGCSLMLSWRVGSRNAAIVALDA